MLFCVLCADFLKQRKCPGFLQQLFTPSPNVKYNADKTNLFPVTLNLFLENLFN